MEKKVKNSLWSQNDEKEVALGICFGCGIGIVLGSILGNTMLGLSGGGVLGVLSELGMKYIKRKN
ncbi:hypothetical protein IAI10_11365 [Clostridium sp. 19966]|uniref:hypothetical protein n=1 Tax=Clostridium sp. 19966 TaxID=2768166 RepID=UPI0028DE15BF|nr:hypothetical protein [Clostridium sp. 19966]MDT8717257.1 hypothetical protein [Clostridium sp. 19966]